MPIGFAVAAIAALLALSLFIWFTSGLIHLALQLFMAGLVGALADAVVPGKLPWGWVGAVLAGLLGSWLGTMLIGRVGPSLFGVPVVPGFVGAVILAVVMSLAMRAIDPETRRR